MTTDWRHNMSARIASSLIISMALCFAIGCSKSSTTQASFGSSSDSSSSPFKSSSKSSSGDDEKDQKEDEDEKEEKKETAFERDVRNYTVEFAETTGEPNIASYQRGLGTIAEDHGITDWERTRDAFMAIGRGIGESNLTDTHAKQLAVALSNDDYDHLMLIRSGMESRRSP
jgi:hypothetical protein